MDSKGSAHVVKCRVGLKPTLNPEGQNDDNLNLYHKLETTSSWNVAPKTKSSSSDPAWHYAGKGMT